MQNWDAKTVRIITICVVGFFALFYLSLPPSKATPEALLKQTIKHIAKDDWAAFASLVVTEGDLTTQAPKRNFQTLMANFKVTDPGLFSGNIDALKKRFEKVQSDDLIAKHSSFKAVGKVFDSSDGENYRAEIVPVIIEKENQTLNTQDKGVFFVLIELHHEWYVFDIIARR